MLLTTVRLAICSLIFITALLHASANPKLHKNIAVVTTEVPPLYAKEGVWNHVMKVQIPCVQDIIGSSEFSEINDTLSVLSDLYGNLRQLNISGVDNAKIHTATSLYRLLRARTHKIEREMRSLVSKTQFAWGLFKKKSCPLNEFFQDEDMDDDAIDWEPFLWTRRCTHITTNTPFHMVMHNYYANATPTASNSLDDHGDKLQNQPAPLHNIKLPNRKSCSGRVKRFFKRNFK